MGNCRENCTHLAVFRNRMKDLFCCFSGHWACLVCEPEGEFVVFFFFFRWAALFVFDFFVFFFREMPSRHIRSLTLEDELLIHSFLDFYMSLCFCWSFIIAQFEGLKCFIPVLNSEFDFRWYCGALIFVLFSSLVLNLWSVFSFGFYFELHVFSQV